MNRDLDCRHIVCHDYRLQLVIVAYKSFYLKILFSSYNRANEKQPTRIRFFTRSRFAGAYVGSIISQAKVLLSPKLELLMVKDVPATLVFM